LIAADGTLFIGAVLFGLGAIFGSGVTALSWRLPRGESWVHGRSRCPACAHVLGPLDLVPIASWALARGRCRYCAAKVSARYPLIEVACAAWAVLAWARVGLVAELAPVLLWGWLLVALTVIDLDFKLLPDALTLPGTLLAVVAALLGPGPQHALLGMLAGAGYLWLFAWIWATFLKREGLGGGDIKLAAMFGALLGPLGAFLTITLAAFVGALAGALLMARGRGGMRTELPFGTCLAPAAMAVFLWGDVAVQAYLSLVRR
jgi:leader peptidase (prepilin peptidase)/N-methyltransferase